MDRERAAAEQRAEAVDAGPVVDPLDQAVLDGVGRGVDQLVHDVGGIDQLDGARRLGRPEVLRPAEERVHRSRDQHVEVRAELDLTAVAVVRDVVVVVRHHRRQDHLEAEAFDRDRQAVQVRLVGLGARPQQELTLHAAPVHHQEPSGPDRAGQRHRASP
ncbi:MAG: hypothetical protein IPL61_04745 [Myxococcales bacterium]|nr:hypothetical protein [Myxococcales bacterium]